MSSVTEHYESHLAPIYVWMAGGLDASIARGRAELAAVCPRPSKTRRAVDLGAGFGVHAIPLADIGYSVLAIDTSRALLDELKSHLGSRAITPVQDDLRSFKNHLEGPTELIVCMGDTLTHLPDRESVEHVLTDVAQALEDGGTFIATFRDYTAPLTGVNRFIPVRSDSDRMLLCFLEYDGDAVMVHDIVSEREGSDWRQRISAYRKLRLSPAWVAATLEARGLHVRTEQGVAGMSRLIATRPPYSENAPRSQTR